MGAESIDQLLKHAAGLEKSGNLSEAVAYVSEAVRREPRNAKALYRLAQIEFRQQKTESALSTVHELLAIDPDNAKAKDLFSKLTQKKRLPVSPKGQASFRHAASVAQTGDFESALDELDALLKVDPTHEKARTLRASLSAKVLRKRLRLAWDAISDWKISEAEEIALAMAASPERDLVLAETAFLRGDRKNAEHYLYTALTADPYNFNSAQLLEDLCGRRSLDTHVTRIATAAQVKLTKEQLTGLIQILFYVGRLDELLYFLDKEDPNNPTLPLDRALLWRVRTHKVLCEDRKVVRLTDACAASNRGVLSVRASALLELGNASGAIAAFRAAFPDPSNVNFSALLFHVTMAHRGPHAAYSLYKRNPASQGLQVALRDKYSCCIQEICTRPGSKVFLVDGGVGDEIRHAAIYPILQRSAPGAMISCDPRLLTLMERSFPGLQFLPVERWRSQNREGYYARRRGVTGSRACAQICDNDLWSCAENSGAVGLVAACIHSALPNDSAFCAVRPAYLKPDPMRATEAKRKLEQLGAGGRKLIGLSWRSSLESTSRNIHYTDITTWKDVLLTPRCVFVNLQPKLSDRERDFIREFCPAWHECDADLLDDFEGTAALMSALDAVVAPATTTIELAGAVGAHAFFLANTYETRWRRKDNGRDIWHNSVTVISPNDPGHNASMLQKLAETLCAFSSECDSSTQRKMQLT